MLRYLLSALTVFYVPLLPGCTFEPYDDVFSSNGDQFADEHESELISNGEDYYHDHHEDQDQNSSGTSDHRHHQQQRHIEDWFEEQLEDDLKWSFALNSPKTVFIMGGGEGSTAREALKHKDVEKVIMCDIDRVVVDFCRAYLTENQEAFRDKRLQIAINDAEDELKKSEEKFDVIVGDLADPLEGGPCNDLYTKYFYQQVLKPKLNENGIFVTQAGPAGILSHKQIFTSIYNTIKHVFKYVTAYTAHVPSYADSCGWVLASDQPLNLDVEKLEKRIKEKIKGKLFYLNGASIVSSTVLNKIIQTSLLEETNVITEENARFIHGQGIAR
ncbi:Polyamine biosynthesis domain containing protein [Trema orientale]|uniref:Polyamine biosynthesis domain containing protein n=1 Tax=Trema orientale TaxID=63057 RepID=A0A2P5BH07_TREOI|nr:Polyamine biosynthesis domain containing protein [Trema orientale]